MNGETLPEIQGWPAKIVIPGAVGNHWVRWLDRIEITSSNASEIIKTWPIHARIFEPDYNSTINGYTYTITGMVNAGDGKEITEVEVSADDGITWVRAEILNFFVPNVWKHWRYEWEIETPGFYTIYARVKDAEGNVHGFFRLYKPAFQSLYSQVELNGSKVSGVSHMRGFLLKPRYQLPRALFLSFVICHVISISLGHDSTQLYAV